MLVLALKFSRCERNMWQLLLHCTSLTVDRTSDTQNIGKVFRHAIMCQRDDSLKTKEKTSQTKWTQRGRRTYDHVVALTDTTVH